MKKKGLIKTCIVLCAFAGLFVFLHKEKSEVCIGQLAGIETLSDGEFPGDYEFGEYCRCKYGSCKAGNLFSFRKWCLGPQPGIIVNCADYDAGCE